MYGYWRPDSGLPRGELIEAAGEPGSLTRATGLLAVGSLILFVGWALAVAAGGYFIFFVACFLMVPAIAFHGAAWYVLGQYAVRRSGSRPTVFVAFVASLVAFGGSLSTFAWGAPSWHYVVFLFPFVPWVWAPVVLAHCALFESAARDLPDPRARAWSRAGVLVLAGLAVLGLVLQSESVDAGAWILAPAGATFVGYLLILSAWTQGADPATVRARYLGRGFAA